MTSEFLSAAEKREGGGRSEGEGGEGARGGGNELRG